MRTRPPVKPPPSGSGGALSWCPLKLLLALPLLPSALLLDLASWLGEKIRGGAKPVPRTKHGLDLTGAAQRRVKSGTNRKPYRGRDFRPHTAAEIRKTKP